MCFLPNLQLFSPKNRLKTDTSPLIFFLIQTDLKFVVMFVSNGAGSEVFDLYVSTNLIDLQAALCLSF